MLSPLDRRSMCDTSHTAGHFYRKRCAATLSGRTWPVVRGAERLSARTGRAASFGGLAACFRSAVGVAARKDERPDAQSSAVFDADYLRLAGAADARSLRMNARSVRRTRNHPLPAHGGWDAAGGRAAGDRCCCQGGAYLTATSGKCEHLRQIRAGIRL